MNSSYDRDSGKRTTPSLTRCNRTVADKARPQGSPREPSVRTEGVAAGAGDYSKLPFSKASELVRDGAPDPRCRPIIHGVSSEALADRIDGPVCARSRHALFCARTASFVGKPKRQLQLSDRIRFEI